ncbi:aminodeoxychorismate synthase component I [Bacillaceae bacterium S4-13-58]
MKTNESPLILFDFVDLPSQNLFINPLRILEARTIEEIETLFLEIEKENECGHYVAGFVSYEAASAFDKHHKVHPRNSDFPLAWFGVYDKAEAYSFEEKNTSPNFNVSEWELNITEENYQSSLTTIKEAIRNGDTYQVNFTARLHANFEGDDFGFYQSLKQKQQTSYSAYLNTGRYRILSVSPELFFHVKNERITTKPMKGTAKRGRFLAEDQIYKSNLFHSEKERAENVMIVDLLRNDIGKIAKPGTVTVPRLFEIETYPTVHQMTSTITADLQEGTKISDWFRALFPCGSITGAPKISTMEYIASLESSPRDVYCGAIGIITPDREAIFNVPIRTVVIDMKKKKATYGVGSGVTWDSTAEGEYHELYTKARILTENHKDFELLESILLEEGKYPLLKYHLQRLQQSSEYFLFAYSEAKIVDELNLFAQKHPHGSFKIRLILDQMGGINMEGVEVFKIEEPISCKLAQTPIDSADPFLFHKTTHREMYEKHNREEAFSVLLFNEKEEITEFTIGNVVVEINGEFFTPPIECGLLPGIFRQKLLEEGIIKEKMIKKEDLHHVDQIWFINSIRGWLQVNLEN